MGKLKKHIKSKIFIRDGYKCVYCGKSLDDRIPPPPNHWYFERLKHLTDKTIDHIIPLSKGGRNEENNLVACCEKCNRFKADKIL